MATLARKRRFTPENVVKALRAAHGAVYLAADALKCAPQTIYTLINEDETVRGAYESERDAMLDMAENQLYEAITRGESWAILFCLRTRGRSRGYGEKLAIERQEQEKMTIIVEYTDTYHEREADQ